MMHLMGLVLALGAPTAEAAKTADTVKEPERLEPQLPPGFALDSRSFQFPSGLRVIMQPDHSAPIVAITTYIDHGSRSDPAGKEGIAHFLEHMWFKSRHIEGSQVKTWDVLEEQGCALNASTSMDWTNYMTVCPKGALPTLMRFASLRLTDTIKGVKPEEADSEREVIRNELRLRGDGTFRNAYQYALKSLFPPDHPYNRLGIGTHDSLDNCSLEDIGQFAKDNYRAEETTIVVVGDFEPDEAGSLIVENFKPTLLHPDLTPDLIRIAPRPGVNMSEIDARNPDRDKVYFVAMDPSNPNLPLQIENIAPVERNKTFGMPVGDPYSREVVEYDAPVERLTAVTAWAVPSGYKGQDVVAQVAANVVGNSMALAFLDNYNIIKDPDTDFPEVGCGYLAFQENSLVICLAEVRKGANAASITEKMLDQLADIYNPEAMANQLMRQSIERSFGLSKLGFLQDTLASLDRVVGLGNARATLIGGYAHHTGDHQYHSSTMNSFAQTEFSEVLGYAAQYLTRPRAAKLVLKPLPPEEIVRDSSESDYVGASSEDDQIVSTLPDEAITAELIREQVVTPDFDKVVDRTLPNGLRVVLYPHGEAPLASFRLVSQGGTRSETFDKNGFVDVFADEGLGPNLIALRIAANWTDNDDMPSMNWLGIDAPSMNSAEALWYLRARLQAISPDFEGKSEFIREEKKALKRAWMSAGYWRTRLVNESMGFDHPAFTLDTWEDFNRAKKINGKVVKEYLARKYHPENMVLVGAGNFDAEEVYAAAQKYWGGYYSEAESYVPIEIPEAAPIVRHEPKFFVFDDERETQTSINASCRLKNGGDDEDAARNLVSTVVDGYLFAELRAKEGITYGAGAGNSSRVGNTHTFGMGGTFQNDGVGIAVQTFLRVVQEGQEGKFADNRIRPAQLALSRKPVLSLQAIEDVAGTFANNVGLGRSYETWEGYGDRLASVTKAQMQEVFEPCADSLVMTMVGPVDIIGPVLTEAGIDWVEVDPREKALELMDVHDKGAAKKLRKAMAKEAEKEAEEAAEEGPEGSEE